MSFSLEKVPDVSQNGLKQPVRHPSSLSVQDWETVSDRPAGARPSFFPQMTEWLTVAR
jgi:hypothetical protein